MNKTLKSIGLSIFLGLIIGMFIIMIKPEYIGMVKKSRNPVIERAGRLFNLSGQVSFSNSVKRASPAVVSISPKTLAQRNDNQPTLSQRDDSKIPEGSGVIVGPEGYILTNNHVIHGADQLVIGLQDGREATASIIGIDPETDLAVLKINLPNLPYLDLVDSSKAEIGDVVLAIGNPFGLGQTVTMGIISATGRNNLQLNTYEDFIQTDAAINIGNSGGALVNAYGDLIGISTLLYSRGGSNEGIGFVIPSNMASFAMNSIITYGRVIRGWLGIESQPLSSALADACNVSTHAGILISGVYDGSPADKAGLKRGDILTGINGQVTSDGRKVMNMVARIPPGQKMTMQVLRNGDAIELTAQTASRPQIVN